MRYLRPAYVNAKRPSLLFGARLPERVLLCCKDGLNYMYQAGLCETVSVASVFKSVSTCTSVCLSNTWRAREQYARQLDAAKFPAKRFVIYGRVHGLKGARQCLLR